MNQQGRAHKTRLCFYAAIGNVKVKYLPDHPTCFRPKPLHRALSANADVGLLLPCSATVQEMAEGIAVTAVDPIQMLGILPEDSVVLAVAVEAKAKLERVISGLK